MTETNQRPITPFADVVGIEIVEATPDRTVATLKIGEDHLNSFGYCHGGVIFTLADHAFGVANNLNRNDMVAMETHIRYLRPAELASRLTATVETLHRGRLTSFFRIDIRDEHDRLIAYLSATGHKIGEPRKPDREE